MQFSNTITIERPILHVFEFVSDLENVPKWNYAIVETTRTSPGPVRVGSTYRQIRSVPSRSEEHLQVTELERDRRFAVKGDLGPLHGTLTYEFESIGAATRLTNTADLQATGVLQIVAPIASNRIRDAVAANLQALKELLEREP